MSTDGRVHFKEKPRGWGLAKKPGAYALATKVGESVIDAGGVLSFEQYICGYGEISHSKIRCLLSSDIFDYDNSSVVNGIRWDAEAGALQWGANKDKISEDGMCMSIRGISRPDWDESTSFFDISDEGLLFTEIKIHKAPFEFSLKTRRNIRPGQHYIDFHFTYFNGCEWVTKKERVDFRVNNKFEQYGTLLSCLAALALVVTIVHDGLAPLVELSHEVGVFVQSLRHDL